MRRLLALAIVALAGWLVAGCSGASAPAADPAPAAGVTHVLVLGELDVGNQALIARAIRAAKAAGNTTLLIEIDTPGGSLDVLWGIQKQLLDAESSGLQLATWIHDHAASAGALVALSSQRVYMSSVGTIGSAMPVAVGPLGMEELPEGVREKEVSFLRSQFASMAEKRGRPSALAMAMVDRDVEVRQVKIDGELRLLTGDEWNSLRETGGQFEFVKTILPRGKLLNLTAREAVELRFVDGIADSLAAVIQKLGVDANAKVAPVLELSNAEKTVVWLKRLMPVLLLLGLVCAYLEIKMPGFGLPGILSIVCFALLLAGQYLAGLADVPHIVAVAVGAILIAVEVFVLPGTLWLGVAGMVLVLGGLILGSLGPGFDFGNPIDRGLILDATARILVSASLALVAALVLSRFLPKTPLGKHLILAPSAHVAAFGGAMPETIGAQAAAGRVGALGVVLADLRPVGKVALDASGGHEWEARSAGPLIERGARVKVVEVSAARLVVERAEEVS